MMKESRRFVAVFIAIAIVAASFVVVQTKAASCKVTSHEDPAMQYITAEEDKSFSAQYIYLRVEESDYAKEEGEALIPPAVQEQTPVVDAESFVKMNGNKILINGKTLSSIYNEYDKATRAVCEFRINPLTRWGYFGIKLPTFADYRDVLKISVLEGCRFPSLADMQDGNFSAGSCFVNTEAYVFVHDDMKSRQDIPDDAVKMKEDDNDNLVFTIKLNRFLLQDIDQKFSMDGYKYILLNGTPLSKLNNPEKVPASQWVAARWGTKNAGERLTLTLTVPKRCKALTNADYGYVENHFILKEGMEIPASSFGDTSGNAGNLRSSFRLGIYAEEVITEFYDATDDPSQYGTNQISGVTFTENDGTGEAAALIKVTFASAISNENIPAEGDYHVIASEDAREAWGKNDHNVYFKPFYTGFMHDGLKSSVLDNIYINGLSLAQWQAQVKDDESVKWRAITIHYGEYGGKVMSIHFPSDAINTKNKIIESYEDGSLSIEFKPGLKFITRSMVKTGQRFVFRKETDSFVPATTTAEAKELKVYYNGELVENNSVVEGYGLINEDSLHIPDDGNDYYVSFDTQSKGKKTHVNVTIYLDKEIIYAFTIKRMDNGGQ